MSAETIDVNADTLNRFVMRRTHDRDLVILMNSIATSCKLIASAVNKAGIYQLYGQAGKERGLNPTGDTQKKLDVMADDMMINTLMSSGVCAVLVSEENDEPIIVPEYLSGKYCVAFDPLDGSSNIDCNGSVGTIFSVFEILPEDVDSAEHLLRTGKDCVCAGYCLYSSAVELVFAFKGEEVQGFTLDPSIGEFVHTRYGINIPSNGGKRVYSINEGNYRHWDKPMRQVVEAFKSSPKEYSARYVGSMVADIHRTLIYGGIFMYPANNKSKEGKLRMLYEGIPMAMLIEQAGGVASTGMYKEKVQNVMDLKPDHIHSRCPIIMGSKRDVSVVYDIYSKAGHKVEKIHT